MANSCMDDKSVLVQAEDADSMLSLLAQVEELAEDILTDKQQIVDLDHRRQKTREAIRALQKDKKTQKCWVAFGNMFLKLPKAKTKKLLEKDFDKLDDEINDVRHNLKPKVNALRDLEHKEETKGFNLTPLSPQELRAVESVL